MPKRHNSGTLPYTSWEPGAVGTEMIKDPVMREKGRGMASAGLSPGWEVWEEPAPLCTPCPRMPGSRPHRPQPSGGSRWQGSPVGVATWGWSCLAAGGATEPASPSLPRSSRQTSGAENSIVRLTVEKSTRDTRRAAGRGREGRGLTGRGGAGRPDGLADWLQAQCTGRLADAPPRGAARRVHVLPPQPAQRFRVLHVGAACAWLSLARGGTVFSFPAACFRFPGQEVFPRRPESGRAL